MEAGNRRLPARPRRTAAGRQVPRCRQLESYRDRLHAWADEYRARDWPVDTPEYLLRGYYRLLSSIGDVPRMLMCATDTDRHDRMLDITGGDSAALAQITTAQEVIANQAAPDLLAMSRLAIHRTRLTERNDYVPASLPAVWVQLGRPDRAEALARSITDLERQVRALTSVAREVVAAGDLPRARILSIQAERAIASISMPGQQAHALAVVARITAETGDRRQAKKLIGRATTLARSLTDRPQQDQVFVAVARATAISGDWRGAKRIALSIASWSESAQALAAVAAEVAKAGDLKNAQSIARSISNRAVRAQAFAAIARAVSDRGDRHGARDLAREAELIARSVRNPGPQAWTLVAVAHAMATVGEQKKAVTNLDLAEQVITSVTRSKDRAEPDRYRANTGDLRRSWPSRNYRS